MSVQFPLQISLAGGPVPTPPATLLAQLLAYAQAEAPGLTTLPGSLVEDISSTDVAAMASIDQARVDAINAVSPYAANAYLLAQLGAMFGIPQGTSTNGNVELVFSGSPGYVIPPGFAVSDGINQYLVQDGGTVAAGGVSQSLYAVATANNTFAIPANSVTQVITSVPSPYTLTVTNPLAGVPASSTESVEAYRARILTAFGVAQSGSLAYLKTLVMMVPGVSPRLVSARQIGSLWEVIVGGGDPYQIAGAIYQSGADVARLTGSNQTSRNITASIFDAPDVYNVIFVNPPQQAVTLTITWNTTLPSFTAGAQVNQLMIIAGQSYLNSIVVGQPINTLVLADQLATAVTPVLAPANLTTLEFTVTINGEPATPLPQTSIILSDTESYFYAGPTSVMAVQG